MPPATSKKGEKKAGKATAAAALSNSSNDAKLQGRTWSKAEGLLAQLQLEIAGTVEKEKQASTRTVQQAAEARVLIAQEKERFAKEKMLAHAQAIVKPTYVLDVGGTQFKTSVSTLLNMAEEEDHFFSIMFSGRHEVIVSSLASRLCVVVGWAFACLSVAGPSLVMRARAVRNIVNSLTCNCTCATHSYAHIMGSECGSQSPCTTVPSHR